MNGFQRMTSLHLQYHSKPESIAIRIDFNKNSHQILFSHEKKKYSIRENLIRLQSSRKKHKEIL